MHEIKIIAIDKIKPNPYQPRKTFDDEALMSLSSSIRENGLIQPISVRKMQDEYEIVAGERRFRAMQLAGMIEVPVYIMDNDDIKMAELALVENIQRENLSAIEEAQAYLDIMKVSQITQSQLAKKMGKSQSSIANKIRLLQLEQEVQQAVLDKKITERHARALLGEKEEKQKELLKEIIKKDLTVANTEKLIHKKRQVEKPKLMKKGISKNMKIAVNTLQKSVQMIERAGTKATYEQVEEEHEVVVTIRLLKE